MDAFILYDSIEEDILGMVKAIHDMKVSRLYHMNFKLRKSY